MCENKRKSIIFAKDIKVISNQNNEYIRREESKKEIPAVRMSRSPAAEGIMKQMAYDNPQLRGEIIVDSAGIGAWHTGQLPDNRMREHAARRGYDLNSRARQVKPEDFDRFDIVFGMDEENIADLKRVARNNDDRAKIRCLADYMTQHPEYSTVPDPYYGTGRDFELALDLIEDACREVAERLTKETI